MDGYEGGKIYPISRGVTLEPTKEDIKKIKAYIDKND